MAILGIDVQLKRKTKLLIFGVPTYMVHNQSMVNIMMVNNGTDIPGLRPGLGRGLRPGLGRGLRPGRRPGLRPGLRLFPS